MIGTFGALRRRHSSARCLGDSCRSSSPTRARSSSPVRI
jgi:hypothetical protein